MANLRSPRADSQPWARPLRVAEPARGSMRNIARFAQRLIVSS
jgi:hypothetical protein